MAGKFGMTTIDASKEESGGGRNRAHERRRGLPQAIGNVNTMRQALEQGTPWLG